MGDITDFQIDYGNVPDRFYESGEAEIDTEYYYRNNYWVTKAGWAHYIPEMNTNYLKNAYKFAKREHYSGVIVNQLKKELKNRNITEA